MSPGSPKLPNYLRAHRKRLGLSQKDLASLMGCKSGAQFSRYERFEVEPQLETAFMCGLILSESLNVLFEGMYRQAEIRLRKQAQGLLKQYRQAEPTPEVQAKIQILETLCSRL